MTSDFVPKYDERLMAPFRAITSWQDMSELAGRLVVECDQRSREALREQRKHEAINTRAFQRIFSGGQINREVVETMSTHTIIEFNQTHALKCHRELGYKMELIQLGALSMAMDNRPWFPAGLTEKARARRLINATAAGALIKDFTGAAVNIAAITPHKDLVRGNPDYDEQSRKPALWAELLRRQKCLPSAPTLIALVEANMPRSQHKQRLKRTLPAHVSRFITDTLKPGSCDL